MSKLALKIAEFCTAYGCSRSSYYNMRVAGQGPVEMRTPFGPRISVEAAEAWRRKMEGRPAEVDAETWPADLPISSAEVDGEFA